MDLKFFFSNIESVLQSFQYTHLLRFVNINSTWSRINNQVLYYCRKPKKNYLHFINSKLLFSEGQKSI